MTDKSIQQFVPFSSALDAGFWYQLTKNKLEVFKLDDKPVEIKAYYSNSASLSLPPIANIDYSAFDVDESLPPNSFPFKGTLINTNTLEDFKLKDKKELLKSFGLMVWKSIKDGSALENPTLLQHILCLTFAELKKYHFYYWIGFPALIHPKVIECSEIKKINDYFTSEQITHFLHSYDSLDQINKAAFIICQNSEKCCVAKLTDYKKLKNSNNKILLGFADPSAYDKYPGWPLRNLLALVSYHWGTDKNEWDVLCLRDTNKEGKRHYEHSIILSIKFESLTLTEDVDCPDVIGWEKNKDKLIPRKVDMSANMDPSKLANAAVDLNLKLMRWRLYPDLHLELIKSRRCLLFGAGTLGCNVARCLMGWGVLKITFIDNSKVSFSNPVRQTLFKFDDCLHSGKPKALAAAAALKEIFPGVDAEGYVLNVPMPGHGISENMVDQIKSDVAKIEELVENHDVIFLLMDTRESRWLPTLLGASKQKLVINAALGFDTFLVMRHGLKQSDQQTSGDSLSKLVEGNDLGCYFCNDIVAPGNSLQDRTLDQQCTVTRPGVSYLASALAVELMVSVLQHPKGGLAASSIMGSTDNSMPELSTEFGLVPHQIRGYLDRFQNTLLTSKAFDRCTACSSKVTEKYREDGFNFLLKGFNDSNYLEEVTGLAELMTNISLDEVLELSDDDST